MLLSSHLYSVSFDERVREKGGLYVVAEVQMVFVTGSGGGSILLAHGDFGFVKGPRHANCCLRTSNKMRGIIICLCSSEA